MDKYIGFDVDDKKEITSVLEKVFLSCTSSCQRRSIRWAIRCKSSERLVVNFT